MTMVKHPQDSTKRYINVWADVVRRRSNVYCIHPLHPFATGASVKMWTFLYGYVDLQCETIILLSICSQR